MSDFLNLKEYDSDTLYFVTDVATGNTDIYLGENKITNAPITGDDPETVVAGKLEDLTDVAITEENLRNNNVLAYNSSLKKWVSRNIDIGIFVLENSESNTHIDLINSYFEANSVYPKNGDIVIIKDSLFTEDENVKYKHTSYIYNGSSDVWEAFDGDYSAENVYFNNDFIVTENIGTISLDKN